MSDDQILGTLLSCWMGFAISLQLSATIARNKILNNLSGQPNQYLLLLVLLIYTVTGLAGVFGFAWLIGHVIQFKGPIFPIGFLIGIGLFLLTEFINEVNRNP